LRKSFMDTSNFNENKETCFETAIFTDLSFVGNTERLWQAVIQQMMMCSPGAISKKAAG